MWTVLYRNVSVPLCNAYIWRPFVLAVAWNKPSWKWPNMEIFVAESQTHNKLVFKLKPNSAAILLN